MVFYFGHSLSGSMIPHVQTRWGRDSFLDDVPSYTATHLNVFVRREQKSYTELREDRLT